METAGSRLTAELKRWLFGYLAERLEHGEQIPELGELFVTA
jgi:predicted RNase H-like HicB family nuclease